MDSAKRRRFDQLLLLDKEPAYISEGRLFCNLEYQCPPQAAAAQRVVPTKNSVMIHPLRRADIFRTLAA
jgi:hypothetical protein